MPAREKLQYKERQDISRYSAHKGKLTANILLKMYLSLKKKSSQELRDYKEYS